MGLWNEGGSESKTVRVFKCSCRNQNEGKKHTQLKKTKIAIEASQDEYHSENEIFSSNFMTSWVCSVADTACRSR